MTNQDKVYTFMEKYGLLHSGHLSPMSRTSLMISELSELVEAMQHYSVDHNINSKSEIADAIGDLLYVVYGTAIVYGLDADRVMDRVHQSNMTKDVLNQFGKQGKGPGFKPPDWGGLL